MDKVREDWNGLQLWIFFKSCQSNSFFQSSFLLFVTFYILLGRHICWTQSSDLVIHTNKEPLNKLGSRDKKKMCEGKCILLALPNKDFESLTGLNFKQFIVISLGVLSTMTLAWLLVVLFGKARVNERNRQLGRLRWHHRQRRRWG